MSGKHVEMFRIKIHPAKQRPVLPDCPTLSQSDRVRAIVDCVLDKPEFGVESNSIWRIGDVRPVGGIDSLLVQLVFEFGKTFVEDDEFFDKQGKVYRPGKKEHTKHTMVYMDVSNEGRIFGGIATPTSLLAPNAVRVADALKSTINRRLADASKDAEVSIDPVYNTEKFEKQLQNAHAVTALSISFGRPNHPLDVKGMLYEPATQMNEKMEADESIHTFVGEHLQNAPEFAKNAADGGFPVSAKIKESADSRAKKISPDKRRLEKVTLDKDEEDASIFGKIADWIKSRIGDNVEP